MSTVNRHTRRKEKPLNLLHMYIHNVNARTIIKISEVEQSDIASAAKEAVITILDKSAGIDKKIEIQELIQVGSSTDGTKTTNQDEFDFMAVLKHISPGKDTKIRKGCKDGFLQVFLKNPGKAWSHFCYQNLLQSTALKLEYHTMFREIVNYIKDMEIQKNSGTLKMHCVPFLLGTNFHWMATSTGESVSNDVYVDIMPTIKVSGGTHRNMVKQHIPKHLHKFAFPDDCCYLVLKSCEERGNCWQHSFAVAENKLVRSMDMSHKACYRSLKWIFLEQYIGTPYIFTSYMFKTATLTHSLNKCDGNISNCFISILEYLEGCLDTLYMPSVFVPRINLIQNTKMKKQLGFRKIFDREVEKQAMSFLGRNRLELYYDACEASFIVEFWRRVVCLLIKLYKNSMNLSAYDNNIKVVDEPFDELVKYITDDHEQYMKEEESDDNDTWFVDNKPDWKDVKNLRFTYRRQLHNVDMPVFTDLEQRLKRYPLISGTKMVTRKRKRNRDPSIKYKLDEENDFIKQRNVGDEELYFLSKCERFTFTRDERIKLSKIRKTEYEKFVGEKFEK